MLVLPVSGCTAGFRAPNGRDDVALAESGDDAVAAAAGMLGRIAQTGRAIGDLPITDFEILLLHVRAAQLGPAILTQCACTQCGSAVDISFRLDHYVAAVRPSRPGGVQAEGGGRYILDGVAFRAPTVTDLLAARAARRPADALRDRCIPPATHAAMRRRCEGALLRLAPEVSGPVGGLCPECRSTIRALFDVPGFVVAEGRRLAAGIFAEVHLLAAAYGWREDAILALPASRRRRYASLVRAGAAPVSGMAA